MGAVWKKLECASMQKTEKRCSPCTAGFVSTNDYDNDKNINSRSRSSSNNQDVGGFFFARKVQKGSVGDVHKTLLNSRRSGREEPKVRRRQEPLMRFASSLGEMFTGRSSDVGHGSRSLGLPQNGWPTNEASPCSWQLPHHSKKCMRSFALQTRMSSKHIHIPD